VLLLSSGIIGLRKEAACSKVGRILFGMKIRGLKVTVEEEKAIREILSERYSEK
jgi:hypothetical protein